MKRAAAQFGWQTAMSLLGGAATNSMRQRFGTLLLKSGTDALVRAERLARLELDHDPENVEAAIQLATIVSARGRWREAARQWKSILAQYPSRINQEIAELARVAYLNNNDLQSIEELARSTDHVEGVYSRWCSDHDAIDEQLLATASSGSQAWSERPLISILVVQRSSDAGALERAVRPIISQAYDGWELGIVLSATVMPEGGPTFLGDAKDSRIAVWTADGERDFPQTVNMALDQLKGDFCLLYDGAPELPQHALLFLAWEIARNPDADWFYSDFDHLDERGHRHSPCFVGGPDQELNHVLQRTEVSAFRTRLILDDMHVRTAVANADRYGVTVPLARSISPRRVKYIPSVLHHIRVCDPAVAFGQERVSLRDGFGIESIRDYLAWSGQQAEIRELHAHGGSRIRFPIPDPAPLVSIIIPTRDALHLLRRCIESLNERTQYPATEIIIVDNDSRDPATLRYFASVEQRFGIRVIRVPEPFNWSRLNNIAARLANGSILCLLNNDIEVISEGWLAEMVSHALRPDVGVVGAALWHPDGRLQHGGIEFFPGTGAAGHALSAIRRPELPPRARAVQSFQAVTGACLVVRKDVYLAVGGMDEVALPVGYSDVDFCLKVTDRLGLRCLWTPFAELLHLESATRGRLASRADRIRHIHARRVLNNRWYEHLVDDSHYRPVLTSKTRLEEIYPGARVRFNRYRCSPETRLAFIHIPKAAGVSTRRFLRQVFPSPSVLSLSAQTMLRCYEKDQAALSRVSHRLKDAITLLGHFSWGFGEILQWRCVYGTILRDPLARTVSHYRHLFRQLHSPFAGSALAGKPLELLLKKGVIPGNLMLRKILGAPPEASTWRSIDRHCPDGAGFSGFGLPDALWRRQYDEILNGPEVAPDGDLTKIDQAMSILERDFAFVGRAEDLEKQLNALVLAMGAECAAPLERANAAPADIYECLPATDIKAAESYNYLDRILYERIARMPGGYLLAADKLRTAH